MYVVKSSVVVQRGVLNMILHSYGLKTGIINEIYFFLAVKDVSTIAVRSKLSKFSVQSVGVMGSYPM